MWFIYFHSVWALCSAFWVHVNNFHILQASTMVFALLQLWARNFSLKQWTHWVAWHCPSAVCNLPLARRDPAKSSAQLCSPTAEKVLGKPEAQCLPAGWGLSTGLCCLHLCVWEKFRASVAVARPVTVARGFSVQPLSLSSACSLSAFFSSWAEGRFAGIESKGGGWP